MAEIELHQAEPEDFDIDVEAVSPLLIRQLANG
jgi:hypothetical protein